MDVDVRKIREKTGLTQTEMAEMLGLKYRTIQKYEKEGKVPPYIGKLIEYTFYASFSANNGAQNVCANCEVLEREVAHLKELLAAKEEIISLLRGAAGEGRDR